MTFEINWETDSSYYRSEIFGYFLCLHLQEVDYSNAVSDHLV